MTESLSSEALELVSKQRRRYVLQCLTGQETPVALADLAEDVASLERETAPHEVPREAVKRVYLSIYHCDVPKLADRDVVEYERDRNVVSLAEHSDRTEKVVRIAQGGKERHRA